MSNEIVQNTVSGAVGGLVVLFVGKVLEWLFPFLRKCISPLRFNITALDNSSEDIGHKLFLPYSPISMSWKFRVEPQTRFRWLYRNDRTLLTVNLIDEQDSIMSLDGNVLAKGVYRIDTYPLDIYRANRISVHVKSKDVYADDRKVSVCVNGYTIVPFSVSKLAL